MSEYIEREAAKKKHCDICRESNICYRGNSCTDLKCFDTIPAADVRPVVLCRDCVNYGEMLSGYDHRLICHKFALTTKPDDFCSRGERSNCGADMRSTNCIETATADEEREVLNVRAWLNNGAEMKEDV